MKRPSKTAAAGFTAKKVQTQTLGEYLTDLRARCRLPLAEVARVAQVQPRFVEALEQGEYAKLPPAVYVRGFLRSIALVYRINADKLITAFEAEYQIAKQAEVILAAQIRPRAKFVLPRFVVSPRTLTLAAISLLGLVALGYLYFQVNSLQRPPKLQVFSPSEDGVVDSSLVAVSGRTEPGAAVYLNGQPIVVDAGGEFRENLSLAPGANTLVIKSVNKFQKEAVVTRSLVLSGEEKKIAGSFTAAPLMVGVKIGARSAWIYLEADGMEQYRGTMLAGSEKQVTAKEKVVLSTGNAGVTRVWLNGRDLGILGKEGEVIRDIEFTK